MLENGRFSSSLEAHQQSLTETICAVNQIAICWSVAVTTSETLPKGFHHVTFPAENSNIVGHFFSFFFNVLPKILPHVPTRCGCFLAALCSAIPRFSCHVSRLIRVIRSESFLLHMDCLYL